MIDQKQLVLQEITSDEYLKLRAYLGLNSDSVSLSEDMGSAKIIEPLCYSNFEDLLQHTYDTRDVTHVSFKLGDFWAKAFPNQLLHEQVVGLIERIGFAFVHFNNRNHEVGFDRLPDGMVASTRVAFPGHQKHRYGWRGSSDNEYAFIRGVLVPAYAP